MKKFLRQSIYFLMLTLVSNAVGWTFNSEAVADVWFEAQINSSVVADQTFDEHADGETVSHQDPCNHWCHAVGHFMGLPSQATLHFIAGYSSALLPRRSFPSAQINSRLIRRDFFSFVFSQLATLISAEFQRSLVWRIRCLDCYCRWGWRRCIPSLFLQKPSLP